MSNIVNQIQLDRWLMQRRELGHGYSAISGNPPPGMKYKNGREYKKQIAIAYIDAVTRERFDIIHYTGS